MRLKKKASATPKKRERERSEGLVNLVLAFVAHRLPARPGEFGGPCGLQRRSNNAQRSSAPSCRRHQQQPRRAPLIQKCLGRREDHSVSCMRHTHTPRAAVRFGMFRIATTAIELSRMERPHCPSSERAL